jgi:hypothetical protein
LRHDVIRRVRLLFRPAAVAVCVGALVACGEHAAPLHSVGDVQTTFADHGLPLAVVARNSVSTTLLAASVARDWRRTPALGRSRARAAYFVVVVTNRRLLRDLNRHVREAQRTLGGGGRLRWSHISTRHDNVFVVYPAREPRNIERLRRILEDI